MPESAPTTPPNTAEVARRLDRLERHDPATLAVQTYDHMVDLGYKAARAKPGSSAPYIRMIYVAGGRSSVLYIDSAGLVSDNAQQLEFAKGLPGFNHASGNRVRFPFTLGQDTINNEVRGRSLG